MPCVEPSSPNAWASWGGGNLESISDRLSVDVRQL